LCRYEQIAFFQAGAVIMDKRFKPIPLPEHLRLRRQTVEDLIAHPEWSLQDSLQYIKKTLRITSAELAQLARVSVKTIQDIEQGRSEGTVKTMNRIFGVLGLKLGVVRRPPTEY
jgi:DNA-binding XRE family transcriptional regulator